MGIWRGDPWIDWLDLKWAGRVPTDAEVCGADSKFKVRDLAIHYGYQMLDARNWPTDISGQVADTTTLPVDVGSIAAGIVERRRELLGHWHRPGYGPVWRLHHLESRWCNRSRKHRC